MPDLTPSDNPSPPADPGRPSPLLRVEVTPFALVPPEHLRALHAIDPELARKVVEENLELQRRTVNAWIRQQDQSLELQREESKQFHKHAAQEQKAEIDDRARGRDFQGRGQWIATGVTAGGFVLCGIALVLRMETAAIALGCGMIAVLAAVFISGRLLRPRHPAPPPPSTDPTE